MTTFGIQGKPLHMTIVEGNKLKKTKLFTKQDFYVYLEYGSEKFRTKTSKDGHRSPKFGDKATFYLVEGLGAIKVYVWNSNTVIGSGMIQLERVLSSGFDDNVSTIYDSGSYAGEVKVIMHYERNQIGGLNQHPPEPPRIAQPPVAYPHYPTQNPPYGSYQYNPQTDHQQSYWYQQYNHCPWFYPPRPGY